MHNNTTVRHAPGGWTYRYPGERQPFSFEKIDINWWQDLQRDNYKWSLYAGAIYVATLYGLQRWMKTRSAMDLKSALFLWNFTLGVFSIAGFVRTAPGLLDTLLESNGFYKSICARNWLDAPIEYWTTAFSFSKFVELGDTLFIVLRKRRLVLLQWYHHILTLNCVWIIGPAVEPQQIWFMVLNYGVHSLMYPYFALMAIGVKIPKRIANVITTLQLSQMIIGFAVNAISTYYYYQIGQDCARSEFSIKWVGIMYGSFILLFGKLFYDAVFKSGRRKKNGLDRKYSVVKQD